MLQRVYSDLTIALVVMTVSVFVSTLTIAIGSRQATSPSLNFDRLYSLDSVSAAALCNMNVHALAIVGVQHEFLFPSKPLKNRTPALSSAPDLCRR